MLKVGHNNSGTHDKVYIVQVVEEGGGFQPVFAWGRRGGSITIQRQEVFAKLSHAKSAALKQFDKKKKKSGYVNIENVGYIGLLTMEDSWLKSTLASMDYGDEAKVKPSKQAPKPKKPTTKADKDRALQQMTSTEVMCLDNAGLEYHFDQSVTYLAEPHPKNGMLWVYDKLNKRTECFASRFTDKVPVA